MWTGMLEKYVCVPHDKMHVYIRQTNLYTVFFASPLMSNKVVRSDHEIQPFSLLVLWILLGRTVLRIVRTRVFICVKWQAKRDKKKEKERIVHLNKITSRRKKNLTKLGTNVSVYMCNVIRAFISMNILKCMCCAHACI